MDAVPWNHNSHYHRLVLDAVSEGARRALDVGCGDGLLVRRLASDPSPASDPVPLVWPPPETYGQSRRTAERVLPGVRYRRHVLFRYSLTWTKPGG